MELPPRSDLGLCLDFRDDSRLLTGATSPGSSRSAHLTLISDLGRSGLGDGDFRLRTTLAVGSCGVLIDSLLEWKLTSRWIPLSLLLLGVISLSWGWGRYPEVSTIIELPPEQIDAESEESSFDMDVLNGPSY